MHDQEIEGVIKFVLDYEQTDNPVFCGFDVFNACRSDLKKWDVIGQDDARYEGYGYGNVSFHADLCGLNTGFVITGTQTGAIAQLKAEDYAHVVDFDLANNRLKACGATKPSSEAMTHAAIYQQLPAVRCVIHGHSPLIWQNTQTLNLAVTQADIPYGTPQMAFAMQELLQAGELPYNTISMLGHLDGFITWGESIVDAIQQVERLLQIVTVEK